MSGESAVASESTPGPTPVTGFTIGKPPAIQRTVTTVNPPVSYTQAVLAWWIGYDLLALLLAALLCLYSGRIFGHKR